MLDMSTASRVRLASLIALLVAGCSGGEGSENGDRADATAPDTATPDASTAREADWSCIGAAAPDVPQQIAVSGTMFEPSEEPIAEVVVELLAVADDAVLGSATTAADGTFRIDVAPGPDGLAAYLRATPADRLPLYNYFDGPLVADAVVPMLSLSPDELTVFYGFVLGVPLDDTKSTVSMVFKDCAEVPVADVVISLDPDAERIAYYSEAQKNVDNDMTTTDASGFAFGVNAPAEAGGLPVIARGVAGEVELEASLESHPGALVSILVRP